MHPTLRKLTGDIFEAIHSPGVAAGKQAIGQAGKVANDAARQAAIDKKFIKRLEKIKSRLVPHSNDDLATVAAVTDYSYSHLVNTKLVKTAHRAWLQETGKHQYDARYDQVLDRDTLAALDADLERTLALMRDLRPVYDTAIPGCAAAVASISLMDLKSMAGSFTSLMAGDIELVKHIAP